MRNIPFKRYATQAITILIAYIILSGPIYLLYRNTREIIIDEASKQAISVAVSIAKYIENDPEKYILLSSVQDYSAGNYDEAYYQDMLKLLHNIKTNIHADYVYTVKKISETEIVYVLDGEQPGSENFSPIGSTDLLYATEAQAFDPGIVISSEIIHDPVWGDILSCFSPIRDPKTSSVIGVVGVDFSAAYINTILRNILILLIFVSLFLVVLISIAVDKLLTMRNNSMNTDFMTNLYSKRFFSESLARIITESKRTNDVFCLMMMDIDKFKSCNDLYGHPVGDKVLIAVSEVIRMTTRRMDACFRYGGDEFVVILPQTTLQQAETIAKRLQHSLEASPYPIDDQTTIPITLSIGIAIWKPSMNADQITELADQAMYSSKNEGRNRITTI